MSQRSLVRAGVLAGIGVLVILVGAEPAFASKVDAAPASFALSEGGLQVVTFTLDEPIIAMSPDPVVTLTLATADPSRVTFSSNTLEWEDQDWAQPRTVQVSAVADGTYNNGDNTVVVTVDIASASEYYNNFATSFTVTVADLDPAPTTTTIPDDETTSTTAAVTPTSVPAGAELPRTGTSPAVGLVASGVCLVTGGLLVASRRRR